MILALIKIIKTIKYEQSMKVGQYHDKIKANNPLVQRNNTLRTKLKLGEYKIFPPYKNKISVIKKYD